MQKLAIDFGCDGVDALVFNNCNIVDHIAFLRLLQLSDSRLSRSWESRIQRSLCSSTLDSNDRNNDKKNGNGKQLEVIEHDFFQSLVIFPGLKLETIKISGISNVLRMHQLPFDIKHVSTLKCLELKPIGVPLFESTSSTDGYDDYDDDG
ncbi:hypothetical protein BDA99DRAFT_532738 [Phascolomyces articulosus]|uniref:Uncharacterized protein n=1 Tax=Phascolomyces articulosus TaxID=60185 RepID=A0AAD5KA03_9FUNG|nr:hypothetical protein BDA99DRAFT_532738 [Phascolomyces articulosus]